jgi:hypothetical protein
MPTNARTTIRRSPNKKTPPKYLIQIPIEQLSWAQNASGEYLRAGVVYKDVLKGKKVVGKLAQVNLEQIPTAITNSLRELKELDPKVKAVVDTYLDRSIDEIMDTVVDGPDDLSRLVRLLAIRAEPVVEYQLNGHWYPIPIRCSINFFFFSATCEISADLHAQDEEIEPRWHVTRRHFIDEGGLPRKRMVRSVLEDLGLRLTTPERLQEMRRKLLRAEEFAEKFGKVVDAAKSVLVPTFVGWWKVLMPTSLSGDGTPRSLIIDNQLERAAQHDSEKAYTLPVLRLFSPDLKKFVYIDIDDVSEHVFDEKAKNLIVLPEKMKHVLDSVFDTAPGKVFGDLFRNRHGGIIILASGGPGVGKTLTAEVYAEYTKRPLYVMEMGELGTNLDSVEGNLQKIFDRARRWNAVLLFDEADVFLGERGEDIEKAAIVGVFLRLLDRYEGCLFLTTNRPDVIDKAFKSRITLALKYPDLDAVKRKRVWDQLLAAAGLVFEGDAEALTETGLNGRNIRNAVRVLKMLHPDKVRMDIEDVNEALEYIAR